MKHELKTWPKYFSAVWHKTKTFEVRKNDRGFKVGDTLVLREFVLLGQVYSGREIHTKITYILEGSEFGIQEGFCVIGFNELVRMSIKKN